MITTDEIKNYSQLEETFYEKKFYFSYGSLSKLIYCPEIFYREYILGDRDEKTDLYLTEGKLIHSLLLEPEKFEEEYVVMTGKIPSENTKIVIDRVFAHHTELKRNEAHKGETLESYGDAIIDILSDMNLHQSLKTDEQRIVKICTLDSAIYWDFLCKSAGKQIVDAQTYEKCKAVVEKVKSNEKIKDLLKLDVKKEWWHTIECHNELELSMDLKKYPFGLKGIIDNLVVDPGSGIIRINDIKTTSKSLKDFPETVKFYRYDLQAAVYNLMVTNRFQELIKQGYKVEFRFIVIDKNQQAYPF